MRVFVVEGLMKKKNIILVGIVAVIVVICILGVVIGFGLSDKSNGHRTSNRISEDMQEETSKDKSDEKESSSEGGTEEETVSEKVTIEETTAETTTEEVITEETTTKEVTTEESTTEEITTEQPTTEQSTTEQVTEDLNRLSYNYMLIDGQTIYEEYNVKIIELYNAINAERARVGVGELALDVNVSYIACARASLISYESAIAGTEEIKYYDLMNQSGINFSQAFENTAAGHSVAKDVVSGNDTSWKTSEKHYENMISSKYTRVGVGVDYSETMGYVWVAIFLN